MLVRVVQSATVICFVYPAPTTNNVKINVRCVCVSRAPQAQGGQRAQVKCALDVVRTTHAHVNETWSQYRPG